MNKTKIGREGKNLSIYFGVIENIEKRGSWNVKSKDLYHNKLYNVVDSYFFLDEDTSTVQN